MSADRVDMAVADFYRMLVKVVPVGSSLSDAFNEEPTTFVTSDATLGLYNFEDMVQVKIGHRIFQWRFTLRTTRLLRSRIEGFLNKAKPTIREAYLDSATLWRRIVKTCCSDSFNGKPKATVPRRLADASGLPLNEPDERVRELAINTLPTVVAAFARTRMPHALASVATGRLFRASYLTYNLQSQSGAVRLRLSNLDADRKLPIGPKSMCRTRV